VTKRIALALAVLVGCSSDGETDAPLAGQDAPKASAPGNAGAEIPGRTPETELRVGPPLLDWSFEPASPDCNGWSVAGAEAIRASPPRSGAYSCKVCANGNEPSASLTRDLGAVPPGRYTLTAWVRKRLQTAAPEEAHARIEAQTWAGQAIASLTPRSVVHEEWERLEATLDLSGEAGGAAGLRVVIGSPAVEAERCLFIDDVTLRRELDE
jgi:hypothetical protein